MKTVSISEAKNNLSALMEGLKSGSPVLIVDRGRPAARLEPVTAGHEMGETEGCRGSSVTALCGPAVRSRPGRSSAVSRRAPVPAHRRSMRSSKSAGKDGEIHPPRAAGALQLAAAFIAAERRSPSLEVVRLDERLADAARKEGFALVGLATG
jgi:prevent-host-death family protein